jgi:hypothetical protein
MQIKSQHKDMISDLLTAVLLNIPFLQEYHTNEKSRSLLGLLEPEAEATRIPRSFGKRSQIGTV